MKINWDETWPWCYPTYNQVFVKTGRLSGGDSPVYLTKFITNNLERVYPMKTNSDAFSGRIPPIKWDEGWPISTHPNPKAREMFAWLMHQPYPTIRGLYKTNFEVGRDFLQATTCPIKLELKDAGWFTDIVIDAHRILSRKENK